MSERWMDEPWAKSEEFWYSGKVTRRTLLGLGATAAGALGATMLVPAPWWHAFGQAKPYKIGTLQPLSGAAAAGGKTALVGVEMAVDRAVGAGARACFVHGGVTDHALANNRLDELPPAIDYIRKTGLPAGIAGHDPGVFRWAEEHLDCDFYMCSYYNSAHRDQHAEHRSGMPEWFRPEDRQAMVELIRTIRRPVIHYKVLAAGRNDPAEGLGFAARHLRPGDAVCVGAHTGDKPGMLAEDVQLLREALTRASA